MTNGDDTSVKDQVAIALKYDIGSMPAPQVVAKGQGHLAEQILKIARENGIEVRTDAALTEILAVLEIDSFIPLDAYSTVAEILTYIYAKNGERS
jgi:flagellar biosynthesis protein